MPPPPCMCGAPPASFLGFSLMTHSVVSIIPAIDAAFSRATRVTLVGSMIPAFFHVFVLVGTGVVAIRRGAIEDAL